MTNKININKYIYIMQYLTILDNYPFQYTPKTNATSPNYTSLCLKIKSKFSFNMNIEENFTQD